MPAAMSRWTPFPHDASAYTHDAASLRMHWARLHRGDAEPLPDDPAALQAWALFHAGRFEQAVDAGLKAGGSGLVAAARAQMAHATYLEPREQVRLALFLEVAERAEAQAAAEPDNPNAHYLMAYALGRYSQGISVTRALSQGLGGKVRGALERCIALQPRHADAHVALGIFHAEVIDKVGALLGRTQGASGEAGLAAFRTALELNPHSAITLVEVAHGLVMLEGDRRMAEATRLYEQAAACEPADATQRLDVEMAKAELRE